MADDPPKKAPAPLTRYAICRRVDIDLPESDLLGETGPRRVSVLFEEAQVEHHGAVAAIKQHVAALQASGLEPGKAYVAIPESNWTEIDTAIERPPPVLKFAPVERRAGKPIAEPVEVVELPADDRDPAEVH